MVSLYAKLIGELMFIAINTQPLIAQPVNALARFMTNANSELYVLAKGVLRYLNGVKSRKIVWCASRVKFPFVPCEMMILLLLFLQKQSLAFAVYLFGIGILLTGLGLKKKHM